MSSSAPELPFPDGLLTFPRSDYSYAQYKKPRYRNADVTDVLLARAAHLSSRVFQDVQHGAGVHLIDGRIFAFAVLDKVIQL